MMNYWKPYENIRRDEKKKLIITASVQQRGAQVWQLELEWWIEELYWLLPTCKVLDIVISYCQKTHELFKFWLFELQSIWAHNQPFVLATNCQNVK